MDVHIWLHIDKFPRHRRFTLGDRLEATLLVVLECLVEASYTRACSACPKT